MSQTDRQLERWGTFNKTADEGKFVSHTKLEDTCAFLSHQKKQSFLVKCLASVSESASVPTTSADVFA